MSKFFTLLGHEVRLTEIAMVLPVVPEYEDPVKQAYKQCFGFAVVLRSGVKLEPCYGSTPPSEVNEALAVAIRAELMKALENGD